jgi:hypothetical protein
MALFTILFKGRPLCSLFAKDADEAVAAFARDTHCTADERKALAAESVSGW